ncbi:restriction endonuclease subunit S [Streptomyces sp. NBC_01387]|uniref:restriction endonuclease subunit S n=1 Tax=Streptomyces sp. NBC_01387 TaxID=2903849 RepID=UPI00324394DA
MTSWSEVPFGALSAGVRSAFSMGPFGSKITKDNYTPSGVPVVRGVNLANGIFTDDGFVFISTEKADELTSANVVPGDLVFTHRGTIGQVTMIPRNPQHSRYVIGSSQVKCRLDESKAIPEFYYYWFTSPQGQHSILAHTSTVGVPGIATPLSTIKRLQVPLPSLAEQRAIAEILGALDDKIAANTRTANTAAELAEALYIQDSRNSTGWTEFALSDTSKWLSGGTPKTSEPNYWGGDIPWISAASLKSPWLDQSDRKVTRLGAANGTRLVPKGSIIFVVRGMSLTSEFRIGLTQREVAFGQDCKALLPKPGIDALAIFLALRTRTTEILGLVDAAGHGTGRLGTDRIAKLQVRLPQGETAKIFTRTVAPLIDRASAMRRENRTLAELRDTLLPQLVTGKIRVKDIERIVEDAA